MGPLVTIGIPTYNRADGFLQIALSSAVNQTYQNLEIIVSDNCSTDHTESLVAAFDDPRIKYVKHGTNIGAINNFNYCVNSANGRYFILLHDDDTIDDDMVEACIQALPKDEDVGVVFTGNRVIDEKGHCTNEVYNKGAGASSEEFFIGWFQGKTALYLCSTMFNTLKLREIGGFYSKTNHFLDVVAEVLLAFKYGRADVYDVKASFRRHSSNLGGSPAKLKAWSLDCHYLMDILLEQATCEKERLRNAGLRFFRYKNCTMARSIESPVMRSVALVLVKLYFFNYKGLPQKILRRLGLRSN